MTMQRREDGSLFQMDEAPGERCQHVHIAVHASETAPHQRHKHTLSLWGFALCEGCSTCVGWQMRRGAPGARTTCAGRRCSRRHLRHWPPNLLESELLSQTGSRRWKAIKHEVKTRVRPQPCAEQPASQARCRRVISVAPAAIIVLHVARALHHALAASGVTQWSGNAWHVRARKKEKRERKEEKKRERKEEKGWVMVLYDGRART